ncbi:MAG TPA: Mur ligase family protein, partial [bacterium]|nr:Mur ligase family protein [bacterium]
MTKRIAKKSAVIGLGRSGLSVARLLKSKGYLVWATDIKTFSGPEADRFLSEKEMEESVKSDKYAFWVISPGVDPRQKFIRSAEKKGIKIYSEIEVASWYLPEGIRKIAITGTKGKTTTTQMTAALLKDHGFSAESAGNIGLPLSDFALNRKRADYLVIELSSFQLERIEKFSPEIRVLLNLQPDHGDRYGSFRAYYDVKWNIFKNAKPGDWIILNY